MFFCVSGVHFPPFVPFFFPVATIIHGHATRFQQSRPGFCACKKQHFIQKSHSFFEQFAALSVLYSQNSAMLDNFLRKSRRCFF